MISPRKIPIEIEPPASPPLSDEQAWDAVTKRRPIGQIVFGEAVQIEPWGAFFDIGERFPAFIDPLDLQNENLSLGSRRCLKVIQHADWNRQIRVMFATQRESFVAMMSPIDRAGAGRIEGQLVKFRDEFNSWSIEERTKYREAVWHAARANDLLGLLPGGFRSTLESGEDFYDEEGNVAYSYSWGQFSPKVMFHAVEAWCRGEDFLPVSLVKLIGSSIPQHPPM